MNAVLALPCNAFCLMGQEDVNEKTLNVRLPESEFLLLARYAAETGRTKTDVVRELLRSLEQKLAPEAKLKKPKAAKHPDARNPLGRDGRRDGNARHAPDDRAESPVNNAGPTRLRDSARRSDAENVDSLGSGIRLGRRQKGTIVRGAAP